MQYKLIYWPGGGGDGVDSSFEGVGKAGLDSEGGGGGDDDEEFEVNPEVGCGGGKWLVRESYDFLNSRWWILEAVSGDGGNGRNLVPKASGSELMRVTKTIKEVAVAMKDMEAILSLAIGNCLSFLYVTLITP